MIRKHLFIAVVFGLLLSTTQVFAIADKHTWSPGVAQDSWSTAGAWTPAGPPEAGDTATFDATSAVDCVINGNPTGIIFQMNTGAGTVTIKTAGTFGVTSFTQAAGTFVDNGCVLTSSGDVVVTGGTFTSTGTVVMAATGNLSNAVAANVFDQLHVEGAGSVIATRTADVYARKLTIGMVDTIKGGFVTHLQPVASNFLVDSGGNSIGGATDIYLTVNAPTSVAPSAVSISDSVYIHGAAIEDTMVIGAAFSVGDLVIDTATFMDSGNVVTSDGNLVIGDGAKITSESGRWDITGSGNVANRLSANTLNALVISGTGTIVVTRTGNVYAESVIVGTADSLKGAYTLFVAPDQNYFFANGGVVEGGYTDFYLESDATLNGFAVTEPLTIRGSASGDSLLPLGAITASNITVGTSATLVDGGFAITSVGNITIHDTATSLVSTATWNQTAAGTVVNRRPRNAFYGYYVASTCTDTILYNPTVADDTFAVADSFNVVGTRGSTFLLGKTGGTVFSLPAQSTASACDIENIHATSHVLRAVGCMARGHVSGVICQQ